MWTRAVARHVVNAMADVGSRFRDVWRNQSLIDGPPGLSAIVGSECTGGRNGDIDALGVARIQNDGVQAHATRARLPTGSSSVAAQPGEFLPVLPAVGRAKQAGVFYSGIDRVRLRDRRFNMPDALELPRVLRAVVPHVSGKWFAGFCGSVIHELVALAFGRSRLLSILFARRRPWLYPPFPAVVGPLTNLSNPSPAF